MMEENYYFSPIYFFLGSALSGLEDSGSVPLSTFADEELVVLNHKHPMEQCVLRHRALRDITAVGGSVPLSPLEEVQQSLFQHQAANMSQN